MKEQHKQLIEQIQSSERLTVAQELSLARDWFDAIPELYPNSELTELLKVVAPTMRGKSRLNVLHRVMQVMDYKAERRKRMIDERSDIFSIVYGKETRDMLKQLFGDKNEKSGDGTPNTD